MKEDESAIIVDNNNIVSVNDVIVTTIMFLRVWEMLMSTIAQDGDVFFNPRWFCLGLSVIMVDYNNFSIRYYKRYSGF